MDIIPKFYPISRSWVAIHPNSKGIIQFIGSFVFGSFPIKSYKYLFQELYQKGYTIFVYRFPFNILEFNHWKIALSLLEEQFRLKAEVIKKLIDDGQTSNEQLEMYLDDSNYYWVGHSLGCKYIALLEILSNELYERNRILQHCIGDSFDKLKADISSANFAIEQAIEIINNLAGKQTKVQNYFIKSQPSLLLAPEISNTAGVENPFLNLFVFPNGSSTRCMIKKSQDLFNLTAVISFNWDCVAEDDVNFFIQQLQLRHCPILNLELKGWHFEPLAIEISELADQTDQILKTLRQRLLKEC